MFCSGVSFANEFFCHSQEWYQFIESCWNIYSIYVSFLILQGAENIEITQNHFQLEDGGDCFKDRVTLAHIKRQKQGIASLQLFNTETQIRPEFTGSYEKILCNISSKESLKDKTGPIAFQNKFYQYQNIILIRSNYHCYL